MAFDSAADLLFRIGANSDDAEANVARFRQLLSTDLAQIGTQFGDWSTKVFGSLETVSGALLGITAGVAAAGVAVAAYAVDASKHFSDYAIAIDNASKKTGISIGDMSKLHEAAEEMGVGFDSLVTGLVRLSRSMYATTEGQKLYIDAFARLGITQKDIAAGQQNLLPMLEKMSDRYTHLKDGAEKAAISQELFSRGGTELIRFLNMGSAGIKEFSQRAEEMGLVLTEKDVQAARAYQASLKALHEEQEALDKYIGEKTLPLMTKWAAFKVGFLEMVKAGGWAPSSTNFLTSWTEGYHKALAEIQRTMELATKGGGKDSLLPPETETKVKEIKTSFEGLTTVLGEMKGRLAELDGPWAKVEQDAMHTYAQIDKATAELAKLQSEGKITGDVYQREMAAMQQLPKMIETWVMGERAKLDAAAVAREQAKNAKIAAAGQDLVEKLNGQSDQTYEKQVANWNREMDGLRVKMASEKTLTAENEAALVELREAGLNRIGRAQSEAFVQELTRAQEQMARIVEGEMTTREKLQFQYEQDLAAFSEAQEAKKLAATTDEGQRAVLSQQYELNRQAITKKYQTDLQQLVNSQGWQGVFGSAFGQHIRENEALTRQWATGTNQSLLMVRVAMQSLDQMGRQAFDHLAQGMGGNIAQAIVYGQSMGQAMRAALAATLESIAAESLTQAIYATALGFMRLAQYDYAGASAAFQAAALFGSVGVASAVAGRVAAPAQGAAASGGAASAAGGASYGPGGGAGGAGYTSNPGGVQINIYGHVMGVAGIEQVASMLNDAVQNRDVRLVATQVRQQTRATF